MSWSSGKDSCMAVYEIQRAQKYRLAALITTVTRVDNLLELGQATGRTGKAEELVTAGRVRLEKIAAVTRKLSDRPRVFCMEWLDDVYSSGHWVPEMMRIAGGVDALAREGGDSVRIP